MRFNSTKLKNGLTLIGEQRESAVSTAIGFFVRTGARDEQPQLSGVSHFLEHMMFKGSAKRSALEVTYALGAIGAQANAYTTEENTVYYLAVLPEYFGTAFEIIADMLRPALDQIEFDTEKKVILEEIALYQDRPVHVLFEATLRAYFRDHPAGNPVLGTTESISALTRNQMAEYFSERYAPSNVVLAASGNFVWEEFVELAERYCSSWVEKKTERVKQQHIAEQNSLTLTRENLQRAHVSLIAAGPSAQEDTRYAANVMSCIMGDSSGSRVYWDLIDKGLADSASVNVDEMDGTGLIYAYASTDPERLDQITSILSGIMTTPTKYSQHDLDRAKIKIGTSLVLQGESTMRRLMAVGSEYVYRNDYVTLDEELNRIKRITMNDIDELLERYTFEPTTCVKLIPA